MNAPVKDLASADGLTWFDVGTIDDIRPLGGRRIETPLGDVGIFRTADDRVFALDNRCPHRGGPLSEGIVHGEHVTCPLHNTVISLCSGVAANPDEGCTASRPVRVEDGRIMLGLPLAVAAA